MIAFYSAQEMDSWKKQKARSTFVQGWTTSNDKREIPLVRNQPLEYAEVVNIEDGGDE